MKEPAQRLVETCSKSDHMSHKYPNTHILQFKDLNIHEEVDCYVKVSRADGRPRLHKHTRTTLKAPLKFTVVA